MVTTCFCDKDNVSPQAICEYCLNISTFKHCTLQYACKYKLLNDKYSQEREKHSLGDTLPWKSRMLEFL